MQFAISTVVFVCAILPLHADFLADARERLANGEHAAAVSLFEKHLQSAPPSAAVYFELGQSVEKTGKEADAALAYRRALLLDPRFVAAATALRDSNAQLGVSTSTADWRSRVAEKIPLDPLFLVGSVAFWIGAFGVLAALIPLQSRRGLLLCSAALFLAGLGACALGWAVDPRIYNARQAMVLGEKATALYKSPTENVSDKITTLSQGSVVKILNVRGRWFHVELPGGQRGWFLQEGVVPVIPSV
jgi:tetratricopeptide (TPR) repeat protein